MDYQLLVFIKVAELQNFSRAAKELHMSQPAVSQHIQALEQRMGTTLLERTNKYVRLNKAGEIVYHTGIEILQAYTRMNNLVNDLVFIGKGEVSIGASYTFGEYILPHIIAQLRQEFPLIIPKIVIGNTHNIAEMIDLKQLDVGIVEGHFKQDRIKIEPFADDKMFVVISTNHRLANKMEILLSDLQNETWILRETGSGTREAAETMFSNFKFTPKEIMEFGSTQIIKESVEAGVGISLLSHWAVRKEVNLGSLKLLKVNGNPIIRKFSIIRKKTEFHTKASELFLEILQKNKALTFPK
ncbi:MAG TPA: LysR family transcriptional regulator [Bacillus bacterium]|nr:LysR family transcriptional regulator [Bacillus sp. (in: firmicutes)]